MRVVECFLWGAALALAYTVLSTTWLVAGVLLSGVGCVAFVWVLQEVENDVPPLTRAKITLGRTKRRRPMFGVTLIAPAGFVLALPWAEKLVSLAP